MDNAASNGHLKIMRLLHENTRVGRTASITPKNRHLEVIKWLALNYLRPAQLRFCTMAIHLWASKSLRVLYPLRDAAFSLLSPALRSDIFMASALPLQLILGVAAKKKNGAYYQIAIRKLH